MKKIIFFFALLPFVTANSYGQEVEELTAKKFDDVEWYIQSYFEMEVAKYDSAALVLKNHLIPATKASGMEASVFQYPLGEWHFMVQFRVDGPEELGWEISPFTVELMKHLEEQEGGAKALPYWGAAIKKSKSELVMKRKW